MAPSPPPVASQLRQLVYYHLDNNLIKNALFLAARLAAYDSRNGEAVYLYSLCQFQSGFTKAAWDTSRNHALRGLHLGCCYVFAQACLELGRFVDGLSALEKCRPLWQNRITWNQHSETRRLHLPDAAAVLCLRGKLLRGHKNMDQAVECWAAALKLNPFMWDAFTGLCDAGAKISVPNIYKLTPEMIAMVQAAQVQRTDLSLATEKGVVGNSASQPPATSQHASDPFLASTKTFGASNHGSAVLFEKLNNSSKVSVNTTSTVLDEETLNTPSTIVDMEDNLGSTVAGRPWDVPSAPLRKARSMHEGSADPPARYKTATRLKARVKAMTEDAPVLHDPPPPPPGQPVKRNVSGQPAVPSQSSANGSEPTRKSVRLLNARPPSVNTTGKMSSFANSLGLREGRDIKKTKAPTIKPKTSTTTVGRVVSGNRTKAGQSEVVEVENKEQKPNQAAASSAVNSKLRPEITQIEKDLEAMRVILDLMARLASAQLSLSNYDCATAIRLYSSLPSSQKETSYVQAQIAKAYFEQAQYTEAEKYFIKVKQLAPSRLEDMEVYSTTLWHLKSEIELAYLAHELIEVERLSPQAWCAIGNSFSLQREHEQALKCFRRATQLDSQFAYGFTLQGHEYVANEEFEKALDAYRSAIGADSRHYNAWYGLGKVYERMGKWAIAEQHYRTAARINPGHAVLICCIGTVLEKLKQYENALEMYTRACNSAPKSALSRFKKAKCLMGLGRSQDALRELEILKDIAPEEANVWFLMGRLYKATRQKQEAVRAFTIALNLDPKAAQYIKDAMETLDDDEEMLDDDEDID